MSTLPSLGQVYSRKHVQCLWEKFRKKGLTSQKCWVSILKIWVSLGKSDKQSFGQRLKTRIQQKQKLWHRILCRAREERQERKVHTTALLYHSHCHHRIHWSHSMYWLVDGADKIKSFQPEIWLVGQINQSWWTVMNKYNLCRSLQFHAEIYNWL